MAGEIIICYITCPIRTSNHAISASLHSLFISIQSRLYKMILIGHSNYQVSTSPLLSFHHLTYHLPSHRTLVSLKNYSRPSSSSTCPSETLMRKLRLHSLPFEKLLLCVGHVDQMHCTLLVLIISRTFKHLDLVSVNQENTRAFRTESAELKTLDLIITARKKHSVWCSILFRIQPPTYVYRAETDSYLPVTVVDVARTVMHVKIQQPLASEPAPTQVFIRLQ